MATIKRKLFLIAGVAVVGLAALIVALAISSWMIQSRVPVKLLSVLTVAGDREYATATGTMVTEGEHSAMPLQVSEIKCYAQARECIAGTAMIAFKDSMYVAVDVFPITEWTDSHLIFKDISACATLTYTMSWVSKSVTGIRVKNKNPPPGVDCAPIQIKELRITLRDGLEVWREEERKAQPALIKMLSVIFSAF